MHPSKKELKALVDGRLDQISDLQRVKEHVKECEFCTEFCDSYRSYSKATSNASDEEFVRAAKRIVSGLRSEKNQHGVVELELLVRPSRKGESRMAADGEAERQDSLIATFGSQEADMILRLKRGEGDNPDYLQLVTEKPEQAAHALIRIPELDWDIVTDNRGRGVIEGNLPENAAMLKWQIVFPHAEFDLEPIAYDRDRTEYSEETELSTEKGDRIRIRLEGKTEGHQISLWITELNGKTDFGETRVVVSQGETVHKSIAGPNKPVTFELTDPGAELRIRIFDK